MSKPHGEEVLTVRVTSSTAICVFNTGSEYDLYIRISVDDLAVYNPCIYFYSEARAMKWAKMLAKAMQNDLDELVAPFKKEEE